MRMNEVRLPGRDAGAQATRGKQIVLGAHRDREDRDARGSRLLEQRSIRRRGNDWLVPARSLSFREQEHLLLAAPPRQARVQMKDPEARYPRASCSANAWKRPRSQGSGESFISSGCH